MDLEEGALMKTEKVEFTAQSGKRLAGRLDLPETQPHTYALIAHCFSCSKDMSAISRISRSLSEQNIALFRFDFTGLGQSEGDFADTNFTTNVGDLVSAAHYMREAYEAPSVLIGHSLGGAAALVAAREIPEVKAVATIGAPFDTAHVAHHFEDHIDEINEKGEAEVLLVGRKFKIKKQFIDDIQNQDMANHISQLKKALLVMHSPIDETVDIENARKIYEMAKHPKSFISLSDADHLLMKDARDGAYVAQVLTAWASRYYTGCS